MVAAELDASLLLSGGLAAAASGSATQRTATQRAELKAHVDAQTSTASSAGRLSANRAWTPAEDAVLYERMISPVVLAGLLGRTVAAVAQRRSVLGISARSAGAAGSASPEGSASQAGCDTAQPASQAQSAKPKASEWTAAEDLVIRRTDISTHQMASLLGRTSNSVKMRRNALGITYASSSSGALRNRHKPAPDGIPEPIRRLMATQQLVLLKV